MDIKQMGFSKHSEMSIICYKQAKKIEYGIHAQYYKDVIERFPKGEVQNNPKASIKKVISLEEMINNLTERIKSNLKITFRDFAGVVSKGEKVNLIVSFLAVLELFKSGLIGLNQKENFSDIHIESQDIGIPHY